MKYKKILARTVVPRLLPLGYELVDSPDWAGIGSFLFRKHLFDNVHAFIEFHFMEWAKPPSGIEPTPREFDVRLWCNKGEKPRLGEGEGEHFYENWINLPLNFLLWDILNVKVYEGRYHFWKFLTSDGLDSQLRDASENIIRYGIPWLEDKNSKNPYTS